MFPEILFRGVGSTLEPMLTNVSMCHLENVWLENCPSNFKPIVYRRSVVDTILLIQSEDHVTSGGELGPMCTNISSFMTSNVANLTHRGVEKRGFIICFFGNLVIWSLYWLKDEW